MTQVWIGLMFERKYQILVVGETKQECYDLMKKAWNEEDNFNWKDFTNYWGSPPDEYYGTWYREMEIGSSEVI
jgi:hypothetical protein